MNCRYERSLTFFTDSEPKEFSSPSLSGRFKPENVKKSEIFRNKINLVCVKSKYE